MVNDMAKIKVMDELLANKIAAGEVVERCASVVKELVENSIDAGSTEIKIDLVEAGTVQIKVTDNGTGMDQEDAVLAFSRHATSKVKNEEDLFHIMTLGFRGEALASIASVSKVKLQTCMTDIGTEVVIHGGKLISVNPCEARKGTIITIDQLFYNTPARLKHMKSLYTELASITDYVNKIALSHPDIKFVLTNNHSTLLNTDGSNQLLKTISAVYGIDIARKMIEVESEDRDYSIHGYLSLPEVHRSSRNGMVTIVNGRVVRNQDLNRVINDSYHSYKPDNRYPIVVFNIEVDPTLVDVNVHPTKMDIKFSKMEELQTLITNMIRDALKKRTLIPHIEVEEKIEPMVEEKPIYQEMTLDLNRVAENEDYLVIEDDIKQESPLFQTKENVQTQPQVEDTKEKEERMPELYPVGLVHGTYIICQNEKGMYMIDQHAAKERINYELFKKQMGNPNVESTALLFPMTFEFSNKDFIVLKENLDILRNMNFEVDEFGINSVIIKRHPTWLPKGYEKDATFKILETLLEVEKDFTIEKFNEKVATMMACKLAIKANENITELEMEQLIQDLRNCDNPFNCPHGRPTVIFYSNYDLEKLFKRSGFELPKW